MIVFTTPPCVSTEVFPVVVVVASPVELSEVFYQESVPCLRNKLECHGIDVLHTEVLVDVLEDVGAVAVPEGL